MNQDIERAKKPGVKHATMRLNELLGEQWVTTNGKI